MTNTDRELLNTLITFARDAVDAMREDEYHEEDRQRSANNLDRAILNFELKSSLMRELPVE
jgi:hypothetical protein